MQGSVLNKDRLPCCLKTLLNPASLFHSAFRWIVTVVSSSINGLNSSDKVWTESSTCVEALTMKPLCSCQGSSIVMTVADILEDF